MWPKRRSVDVAQQFSISKARNLGGRANGCQAVVRTRCYCVLLPARSFSSAFSSRINWLGSSTLEFFNVRFLAFAVNASFIVALFVASPAGSSQPLIRSMLERLRETPLLQARRRRHACLRRLFAFRLARRTRGQISTSFGFLGNRDLD